MRLSSLPVGAGGDDLPQLQESLLRALSLSRCTAGRQRMGDPPSHSSLLCRRFPVAQTYFDTPFAFVGPAWRAAQFELSDVAARASSRAPAPLLSGAARRADERGRAQHNLPDGVQRSPARLEGHPRVLEHPTDSTDDVPCCARFRALQTYSTDPRPPDCPTSPTAVALYGRDARSP